MIMTTLSTRVKPALESRQSINLLIEFLMYSKWLWVKKGLIKFKICGRFAMDSISLIMRYYSFLYVLVQINFTEKESQLQKIFLKSAIGFFYLLKLEYLNTIFYQFNFILVLKISVTLLLITVLKTLLVSFFKDFSTIIIF